jgi:hypothetical protein
MLAGVSNLPRNSTCPHALIAEKLASSGGKRYEDDGDLGARGWASGLCCGWRRSQGTAGTRIHRKNVDALVVQWGQPTNMFKMNSGQSSYVWQLSATTDIAMNRGYGSATTYACKVSVIASPTGVVTQLDTDDYNAGGGIIGTLGGYGSMCGQRLGMKPQT